MARILIAYYSRTGNTQKMADGVGEGVTQAGVECDIMPVADVDIDALTGYDGIILGSPTYYGHPAAELKQLVDGSVVHHGQLTGKIGGAFATCGVMGGGVETTVRAILDAMLVHGMIIQGTPSGGHYGPVTIGAPDAKTLKECAALGARVAALVQMLT